MSTHIKGFVPPDNKWKQMKSVYDACETAGIKIPREVFDFFDGDVPVEHGHEVDINVAINTVTDPSRSADIWDVDISKLPPHVKVIRFVNSY